MSVVAEQKWLKMAFFASLASVISFGATSEDAMTRVRLFGERNKARDVATGFATGLEQGLHQQLQLSVPQSNQTDQLVCRPCNCAATIPQPLPQAPIVVPQPCPPMPVCPPLPLPPPRPRVMPIPPPPPPAFICPPQPQCPPAPVCPRPEPCPAPIPRPPPPPRCLPALPAFIAPQPVPIARPVLPPPIAQNDCCCNCVQLCRATGVVGRARAARIRQGSTSIWDDLLEGLSGGPPPQPMPRFLEAEAKCNDRVLEMAILENISPDLDASKRRIQAAGQRTLGVPVNVVCGGSEFSFVVHTEQFCQASAQGVSCYAFSTNSQTQ